MAYSFQYNKQIRCKSGCEYNFDTIKNTTDLKSQAKADAKKHYKHTEPFSACFLVSFAAPPAGLLTTMAVSASKPKIYNLGIPYEKKDLLLNSTYLDTYMKTARKRKALLSWAGFFTGTAFLTAGLMMTGYSTEYFQYIFSK